MGLSDAGGIQGMSGGPVYGKNGAIIGVLTATHPKRHQTLFVLYQIIAEWVAQEVNDPALVLQNNVADKGSDLKLTLVYVPSTGASVTP